MASNIQNCILYKSQLNERNWYLAEIIPLMSALLGVVSCLMGLTYMV